MVARLGLFVKAPRTPPWESTAGSCWRKLAKCCAGRLPPLGSPHVTRVAFNELMNALVIRPCGSSADEAQSAHAQAGVRKRERDVGSDLVGRR